jgi:signal transduction histidine kinase
MISLERVRRKILIVDDDPEITRMLSLAISHALNEQGYDLISASDGRIAIKKVRSDQPDLVLLDLNLPDINGKEILKKIKEINEDIATIVITGHGGEKVAIDLMKAGAVDFISKPFDLEILFKSISDALTLRDMKIEDKRYGGLPSLEKFFPFLAHEVRNPLHAIAGAVAIIQKRIDLKDEILSRSVSIIHEEVQHLTGFVQDCLEFVRRPGESYLVEGQINEIISIVMNVISHMFEDLSKKIKVTYRLDPQLPKIRINYEEIKQAFLNMVKNSFESMPEGGELVIETSLNTHSEPKSVVIVFSDQGSGIREEDIKHIFDPFFTTKLRGSGLGLPICHRIIVDRHRGRIDVKSEERLGTRFIVELPIHTPVS